MDKERQNGRTTLRHLFRVMRDAELSCDEKVLWGLYRSYDAGEGAWPGDDVLSAHMSRSVRTVQFHRARLIELGYLLRTMRGPKPAIFRAVVPTEGVQNPAPLSPKGCRKGCRSPHPPPHPL